MDKLIMIPVMIGQFITTAFGIGFIVGIPILFGLLLYKAIIGIIREIKKK